MNDDAQQEILRRRFGEVKRDTLTLSMLMLALTVVEVWSAIEAPGHRRYLEWVLAACSFTVFVRMLLLLRSAKAEEAEYVSGRRSVVLPPGSRLHAIAGFFYSRKTMERVFEPMLADMRGEYFEALSQGRVWKARWIRLVYYWAFAKSIGLHSLVSVAKQVYDFWKLLK